MVLVYNTRSNYTKCRKTCVGNSRLVLVLLVICSGLRKWREFSKPITKHSKCNTKVNAFDTQVKTTLRNPIIRIIIQSRGTIPLERFVKAAQTVIILSIIGILATWEPLGSHCKKSIGKIPERIVYFLLKSPIILSTCIRTFAMPRVPSTSTGSNWSFPLVNAGIASSAPWNIRLSWIVNPRSAITKSKVRRVQVRQNTISEAISLVFFFSIFIFKLQHSSINGSLRAQQSNLC